MSSDKKPTVEEIKIILQNFLVDIDKITKARDKKIQNIIDGIEKNKMQQVLDDIKKE